ncbi:MAG: phosphatase PAP2 family protein, partial [Oscillospiraceae bacterium]
MNQINQFEIGILDWIRDNLSCNFLDVTMRGITILGNNGIFFIILAIICLSIKKTRKFGST